MNRRTWVMMFAMLSIGLLGSVFVTSVSGQVFYEAPRSQWGGADPYYYGGDDPMVHRFARGASDASGAFGRVNGYSWVSGRRTISGQRLRVFVDDLGFLNAADFGATPDTAHNDRMARLSTHFRKSDLLEQANERDGALYVPAHPITTLDEPRPGTILIRPSRPPFRSHGDYPPVRLRGPVYRFPREMLDRPLPQERDKNETKASQASIVIRVLDTPALIARQLKTKDASPE
jgi:hypothetical protein